MPRSRAAVLVVAISLVGAPASAWAQAGWFLIPSFQLTESFDDNIFGSSSNRQSDFISRFTPGLQGGYQSEPFTLLVNSSFDAEVFARNTDQTNATSGKHAGMTLRYLPTRPLTLSLDVAYLETRSLAVLTQGLVPTPAAAPTGTAAAPPGTTPPGTTPPATTPPGTTPATTTQAAPTPTLANTLQRGRQLTTVLSVSPNASYQVTPATTGTSGYSYTHTTQEAGVTNTSHQVRLGASHQFTLLDTGTLDYKFDIFADSGSESSTTTSNAVTLGWKRQLTPQTLLSLAGGPRFSGGGVSPEVNASLSHEFKVFDERMRALVMYSRSEGFVIGQTGTVNSEVYSGSILIEPIRSFQVNVGGGVTKLTGGTSPDTTTYGVNVGVSYQILKWLAARGSYSYTLQDQRGGNIHHNLISLGFDASYPFRIDQ
jgi:hypothetical protein